MYDKFTSLHLDKDNIIWSGHLPQNLQLDEKQLEDLWDLHPSDFHEIKIHSKIVKTPRWQQAYGTDYHYTGKTNKALPIPLLLEPIFFWSKESIDERLNGILLNWYDGKQGHYIGKHRDSTVNMIQGTPIVTISFGEERIFRLRPWKGQGYSDFKTTQGRVFIMPYETNLNWTHEIPKSSKFQGKRISITIRAFQST